MSSRTGESTMGCSTLPADVGTGKGQVKGNRRVIGESRARQGPRERVTCLRTGPYMRQDASRDTRTDLDQATTASSKRRRTTNCYFIMHADFLLFLLSYKGKPCTGIQPSESSAFAECNSSARRSILTSGKAHSSKHQAHPEAIQ